MNIREELLQEHSKAQALKIANYACSSDRHFKELMQCFLDKEYRVAQRAAWSVCWAARTKPPMIEPYIKDLVAQLSRKDVHNAVIRNSVRILAEVEIPEAFHGEVINACFSFLETPSTPVAIKVFSMSTLHKLSNNYPDIKHELKIVIEDLVETETLAFKARAKRVMKHL